MKNRNAVVDPLIENNIVVYPFIDFYLHYELCNSSPDLVVLMWPWKQFWSEVLIGFISQVQVK